MTSENSRLKITASSIKSLLPGQIHWDTEVKGFGIRCRANTLTYIVKTRINGKQKWLTIGQHGSPWTPVSARKEALRLLSETTLGTDPSAVRSAKRREQTYTKMIEEFLEDHLSKLKPKTQHDYQRFLNHDILPELGHLKISEIDRSDIAAFHRKKAHIPRTANYCLAIISKTLSWAEDMGYRPLQSNPCFRLKKFKESKRKRYLNQNEFTRLGKAIHECVSDGTVSPSVAAAVRLLIFTGARPNEILTLRWDYVDFEQSRLHLPDSKTGAKTLALNAQAIEVLLTLPRFSGNPWVITGQKNQSHLVNLRKPWVLIRQNAGLDDVRLHDLRHSFASIAVNAGASLPMIGALLGHTQSQTTARYAHLADDPLRQLNQQVGDLIAGAMKGE